MNINIPVKIMRVEDWENLAIKWCEDWFEEPINQGEEHSLAVLSKFQELLYNYEKETSQILERKHFVCEVEKPAPFSHFLAFGQPENPYADNHRKQTEDYEAAQSQLVFEGFEKFREYDAYHADTALGIMLNQWDGDTSDNTDLWFNEDRSMLIKQCTLYDFIYHIDRYNKTASEPINLKFTETFIKRIVG